ncbi:hypothetical protein [Cerasicoccus frondis]|uniref:hypothetical protein n=1 Tax=Cerasicoccus frondis TaxID=490090 RepID=UPI002852635F|nr:hypothetical protein [Cerasicoccus frondis]
MMTVAVSPRLLCLAFVWLFAFSAHAQIFRLPLDRTIPAIVEVEEEIVDGYTASRMTLSAEGISISGPPPMPWQLYSGENGQSVSMSMPYREEIQCALYLMPEGAMAPGALPTSIRAYASALEAMPGVKATFVRDEDGAVRVNPPVERSVREFYNGKGEVVGTRERVRTPLIFGQVFYEIDYTLNPDTPEAEAVGEFWFELGPYQALILLKTSPDEFETFAEMLRKGLKDYYVNEQTESS